MSNKPNPLDLDKQATLEDLSIAMSNVKFANDARANAMNLVRTAEAARDSHYRDVEKADIELERHKVALRKVLSNLEKI